MRKYRIRDLREDKDLPQKVVADVLGLSQQQYSRVENEEAEVTAKHLIKLALFYDVSVDYILKLSDIEKRYAFENKLEGSSITISGDSFEAPCVGKYILCSGKCKSVYLYKGKTYKISDFGATSIKEVWCQGSESK